MLRRMAQTIRRWRGAASGTFASFKPHLASVCAQLRPRYVLEFGPGTSTAIILRHGPLRIVSIEESEQWFQEYAARFRGRPVELHYRPPGWDLRELARLGGPYDLVFVDGGDRNAELAACAALLAPAGVVFLHDAHREGYQPGIRNYPHVFFPERHSCLLSTTRAVLDRLRAALGQDWSCRCGYCNTPLRNRYLEQFREPA